MVFSSLTFIFFILPLFLLLDFQCRGNTNARNIVLIAVSLLFYTWGSSKHLIILILFGILNFIFGKFLQNTILAQKHKNISLTLLILFCTINILGLAYYKYLFWLTNLIAQHFETLSWLAGSVKDRELPLGISFFTFHALSFLIDIYRNALNKKSLMIIGDSFSEALSQFLVPSFSKIIFIHKTFFDHKYEKAKEIIQNNKTDFLLYESVERDFY